MYQFGPLFSFEHQSLGNNRDAYVIGSRIAINPATKYVTDVIPAKAGIQKGTGCRIMSGMTGLGYLVAG